MKYSHRVRIFPGSNGWPWNSITRLRRRCLWNQTRRVVSGRGGRTWAAAPIREAVGRAVARRWRGSKSYPYLRGRSIVAPRNLNGARDYRPCRHEGGKRGREGGGGEGGLRSYEQTNVIARESALTLRRARLIRWSSCRTSSRPASLYSEPLRWLWFNQRGSVKLLSAQMPGGQRYRECEVGEACDYPLLIYKNAHRLKIRRERMLRICLPQSHLHCQILKSNCNLISFVVK